MTFSNGRPERGCHGRPARGTELGIREFWYRTVRYRDGTLPIARCPIRSHAAVLGVACPLVCYNDTMSLHTRHVLYGRSPRSLTPEPDSPDTVLTHRHTRTRARELKSSPSAIAKRTRGPKTSSRAVGAFPAPRLYPRPHATPVSPYQLNI